MSNDLFKLADRIDDLRDRIKTSASDTAKNASAAILKSLVSNTPVDTSQALSSWIVTLDKPSSASNPAHVLGTKGSSASASAEITLREGLAILEGKKPGQNIYIVNNQPYIGYLNDGSSSQQPAGFVERAALIGGKELKKFKV